MMSRTGRHGLVAELGARTPIWIAGAFLVVFVVAERVAGTAG